MSLSREYRDPESLTGPYVQRSAEIWDTERLKADPERLLDDIQAGNAALQRDFLGLARMAEHLRDTSEQAGLTSRDAALVYLGAINLAHAIRYKAEQDALEGLDPDN